MIGYCIEKHLGEKYRLRLLSKVCFDSDLIVEVGLECQLRRTLHASEAAAVEEGEVLERTDLVRRVDRFCAS